MRCSIFFKDIPEALDNAYEVSKKCNLEIKTGIYVLPDFDTPEELSESDYLRKLAEEGILKKTKSKILDDLPESYLNRFNYELETILKMGYEGYFLIVADFVNWAKKMMYQLGPEEGQERDHLLLMLLALLV